MTRITAPGTFDERRDHPEPCWLCGKRVTGICRAVLPCQCRHAQPPARGGRVYGAIMPDLDGGEGE